MNPGGGGCSEPRLHHCTPALTTQQDKKKKDAKKDTDEQSVGRDEWDKVRGMELGATMSFPGGATLQEPPHIQLSGNF